MAQSNAIFGNLTKVYVVRRANRVCTDRSAPNAISAVMAKPDPAPFGQFRKVRPVTRH